jgi:hypothetical protein
MCLPEQHRYAEYTHGSQEHSDQDKDRADLRSQNLAGEMHVLR